MPTLSVITREPKQVLDLTDQVNQLVREEGIDQGLCVLFVKHTTAALTTGEIGEGTEQDLLEVVEQVIPRIRFRHGHDPSHAWAHMAASLVGPSLQLPVADGRLALGTWQSVLLLELDGPRTREVEVRLLTTRRAGEAGRR